jgi:hypothetical protein
VRERQQIVRLLVKEILVDSASITIRHSLPVPPPPISNSPVRSGEADCGILEKVASSRRRSPGHLCQS